MFDDWDFSWLADAAGSVGEFASDTGEAIWDVGVEAGDWMESGEWEWEWVDAAGETVSDVGDTAMDYNSYDFIDGAAYEMGAQDPASYDVGSQFDWDEGGDYWSAGTPDITPAESVNTYIPGEEASWPSWAPDAGRFAVQTVGQVLAQADRPQNRYMAGRWATQTKPGNFLDSLFGSKTPGSKDNGLILLGVAGLALAFFAK